MWKGPRLSLSEALKKRFEAKSRLEPLDASPAEAAVTGQHLPSAINIGYVDGHSSKIPLQKLKTVYWHLGYVPVDDVWRTSP